MYEYMYSHVRTYTHVRTCWYHDPCPLHLLPLVASIFGSHSSGLVPLPLPAALQGIHL